MKMNKRRKRAVTWLVSCLLLLAALLTTVVSYPVTTEAAEIHPYVFGKYTAYMTGVCKEGETLSGDIVIPETFTYKGVKYTVTEIVSNDL
jgi:hypothetical protein